MNKNMKRAFTITELVIVIAVVAILAAVLIPTFSNLIEKANVSNDTVLVRNLNEALIIAETTEGKPATMHDALTAVAEQGYTVEKLTPRSTGHILWEQTSNRFALVKDNAIVFGDDSTKAEIGYTYWKITSNLEEVPTGEYSYYLADEVDESVLTEALAVSTGLDVGNNSNISINYANNEESATAQNVIFRTNGGKLSINGSKDTVSHYGTANVVEITAVAGNSYHEYDTILGNISLKQGRVVLENKSEVSSVVVTATSLDNVAIEDKSGNNTTVAATNDTVAGQLATSDKISGTTNVQETVVDETQMSLFAGGIGTEASPYLLETVQHIVNIELLKDEMSKGIGYNFKMINDIDISSGRMVYYFSGVFDGNNHSLYMCAGGNLFGILTGNTVIKNMRFVQPELMGMICAYTSSEKTTFENITVVPLNENQNSTFTYYGTSSFTMHTKGYAEFINCVNEVDYTIPADGSQNYAGIFVGNYAQAGDAYAIAFENCINKGIVTGGKVGFFVGNDAGPKFTWVDSKENITSNSGTAQIYVDGCRNDGTIRGTEYCKPFVAVNTTNESKVSEVNEVLMNNTKAFMPGNMLQGSVDGTLSLNGTSLVVDVLGNSSIAKVKVTYTVSTGYKDANGNSLGSFYFSVAEEVEVSELATHNFAYVSKIISSSVYGEEEYNNINSEEKTDVYGHKYKIIDGSDGYKTVVVNHNSLCEVFDPLAKVATIGSNPTYSLIMFNSDGTLIGSRTYAYGTIPQL